VIFIDEMVGGRERVTTYKERVLREGNQRSSLRLLEKSLTVTELSPFLCVIYIQHLDR